jgi:hypothetical protein
MLLGAWQFIGLLALAATAGSLLTRADEAIFGLVAALLWWLWAFGATNLVSEAGQSSELAIALVGGVLGVLALLIAYADALSFLAGAKAADAMERRR